LANLLADKNHRIVLGQMHPTDANIACRPLYSRNGFAQVAGNPAFWSRPLANSMLCPTHVCLSAPLRLAPDFGSRRPTSAAALK